MKKSKLSLVLAFAIILALVTPFATYATEADANEPVTTSETADEAVTTSENSETSDDATTEEETSSEEGTNTESTPVTPEEIKGAYHQIGFDYTFDKIVDGNAFLIGNNITINAKVNGDLYVLANTVKIEKESQILGNVFVLAKDLTQVGIIYNLFAAVTNYNCEYDGMTALDLRVLAKNIKFGGYVERSAYFLADKIELTDEAYIIGNVNYHSPNEIIKSETTTTYGDTTRDTSFLTLTNKIDKSHWAVDYTFVALTLLATILGTLFIVNFFKPQALRTDIKFGFLKVLKALGFGLLGILASALIIALLIVSGLFFELGITILLGLMAVLALSSTVAILTLAIMLFNKINKNKSKLFAVLYATLITLVYFGLSIIPVAGLIIKVIVNLIGFGLVILWFLRFRKNNKEINNKIKAEIAAQKEVEASTNAENSDKKEEKSDKKENKEVSETKKEATKKDDKKVEPKKEAAKSEEKKAEPKKDEAKSDNKKAKNDK